MKETEYSNISKIWHLLKLIHVHPMYLCGSILLSLLTAVFEGVGIGLLIPILTGFLQKNFSFIIEAPYIGPVIQMLPESVLSDDRILFGVLLWSFVAIIVLKNIFRYMTVLSVAYFYQRCVHHLRKTLFAKYLSFGMLFFDTTNIGHHCTLLMEFSYKALRPVQKVDKILNSLFSLIVYLGVLLTISWRLTVLAIPLFVLLYVMIKFMINSIRKISYAIADRGRALGKKSVEILSTITLVKSYRTEQLEQQHYTRISDEKTRLDFRNLALNEMISPLQEIMTLLAVTGIFIGSLAFFGRDQIASAPALVVYFYVIINASHKFGAISGFRSVLAVSSGSLDAVMEIFDGQDKFVVPNGTQSFNGVSDSIECRNLSYSYNDDRRILDAVSFSMKKGQLTAIVGPTGAGKSTIINLLMRFYDCPPESIFIDGIDIRSFILDSYLSHVAIVSQETMLLNDSLRNNIAYGLKDVSEGALQKAVSRARLSDFVSQLPKGLDTIIGDRGVKLSGGEKQRVSIARALLKESEILILDEATSSLDSRTERMIQEAINEAIRGRTAIVIAHRLSTIKHADKIIVLKDGRVEEEGTLEDLLERKGTFFELWEEQKF